MPKQRQLRPKETRQPKGQIARRRPKRRDPEAIRPRPPLFRGLRAFRSAEQLLLAAQPALLGALVLAATILRGLYFRPDQLTVAVVVLFLAALVLLARRFALPSTITLSFFDVTLAGFTLVAWCSLLWASERRLALQAALVLTTVLVLYAYLRTLQSGAAQKRSLLFSFSSILLASWAMAGGLWAYPSAVLADRLAGPFQYPDTAGAVYLAGWFFLLLLRQEEAERAPTLVLAGLEGLAAYLFLLTVSRGALLAVPVLLLALLVVGRPADRIRLAAELLLVAAAAFLLASRTAPFLHNQGDPRAMLYGALAGAAAVAVALLLEVVRGRHLDRWPLALGALAAVLLLGGLYLVHRAGKGVVVAGPTQVTVAVTVPPGPHTFRLAVQGQGTGSLQVSWGDRFGDFVVASSTSLQPGTDVVRAVIPPAAAAGVRLLASAPRGALAITALRIDGRPVSIFWAKALPPSLYHRFLGFSATDLSVWERIDFWRDGLHIFLARPVLGWGGYAWRDVYRAFQSFNYDSNEAHSSVVDALVSYGSLGLVLELLLAAGMVLAVVRSAGRGGGAAAALLAALAIWLHSLIDFDLSLAAVLLLLWLCLAASEPVPLLRFRLPAAASLLRLAGAVLAGLAVWSALLLSATNVIEAQHPGTAALRQAVQLDPLSAAGHYELALAEMPKGRPGTLANPVRLAASLRELQAAVRLNPYSETYQTAYAQTLLNARLVPQALQALQQALRDQPMDPVAYENVALIAEALGQQALEAHERSRGLRDYRLAWQVYQRYLATERRSEAVAPANLQLPPPPAELTLQAGEAAVLLKRPDAVRLLQTAAAEGQSAADPWLAALGRMKLPAAESASTRALLRSAGVLSR